MSRTDPDILKHRNERWLAEWREKFRRGERPPSPHTRVEQQTWALWHAGRRADMRHWLRLKRLTTLARLEQHRRVITFPRRHPAYYTDRSLPR